MNEKLVNYISSQSRNKLIFYRDEIPGIKPVNIGLQVSEAIFHFNEPGKLPMRVSEFLTTLFDRNISPHELYGKYLAIYNLGILLEPDLKIDLVRMFVNHSQNNLLFVHWEGESDADNLYFLTKANGIRIPIGNISHIVL